MGDADKTASGIFSKTTKRISPLIIFTEVHGHKYSSFYLFDELSVSYTHLTLPTILRV